jgi:hypothetical protein
MWSLGFILKGRGLAVILKEVFYGLGSRKDAQFSVHGAQKIVHGFQNGMNNLYCFPSKWLSKLPICI